MGLEGLGNETEKLTAPSTVVLVGVLLPPRGYLIIGLEFSAEDHNSQPGLGVTAAHHHTPSGWTYAVRLICKEAVCKKKEGWSNRF